MPPIVEWAIRYAEIGWYVVPQRRDKVPLTPHGARQATRDIDQIRDWWHQWPTANIAIAPREVLCVLDIDLRKGGYVQLVALTLELGKLPESSPVAVTGGGGRHIVFRDPGTELRGSFPECDGVEIKVGFRLFTAPPSVHASGRRYEWVRPPIEAPPELPEAWLDLARRPPPPPIPNVVPQGNAELARRYLSRVDPAVQGQGGHKQTYWMAQILTRGFCLPFDEAWPLAVEWNSRCKPPWDEADLAHKLRSAADGQMEIGCKLPRH